MKLTIFAHKFCVRNQEITARKNADYTGGGDPFKNFRQVSELGIDPIDGFLTRMTDKVSRIRTGLSKELQVKDESLTDTLADLANYAMLLSGYMQGIQNLPAHAEIFYGMVLNKIRIYEKDGKDAIERIWWEMKELKGSNPLNRLQTIASLSLLIAFNLEQDMDINRS